MYLDVGNTLQSERRRSVGTPSDCIHDAYGCSGVSLITQILYAVVFCTRYLDLFWVAPSVSYWNFVLKIFYISSSLYIIAIMLRVYPRTREREKAWKFGGLCFFGSLILGPIVALIEFRKNTHLFTVSVHFQFKMSKHLRETYAYNLPLSRSCTHSRLFSNQFASYRSCYFYVRPPCPR